VDNEQGTTILELVICGRSVAIGLFASVPHVWAFAWSASVSPMTEMNSAHVERSMQKIVTEDPVFQVSHGTDSGAIWNR
jgi:hypothetical protein